MCFACSDLHKSCPRIQLSWMYLDAVSGRLMAAKSKSDTASEITKAVVACVRSFGQRSNATTVSRLPAKKQTGNSKSAMLLLLFPRCLARSRKHEFTWTQAPQRQRVVKVLCYLDYA